MDSNFALNFIREALSHQPVIDEKQMFGGTCFMVNEKMCICISKEALLCRIGQVQVAIELENGTCRHMMMNGKASKDYVYVDLDDVNSTKQLMHWLELSLQFNPMAKASKGK